MSDDLARIGTADVYKGDALAGRLRRDRDDVVFEYTSDYLQSQLPPVATTLPRTPRPVRTRGGAVPPFFAGLLPEGRRLVAIQNRLKTSRDDELSQLLAIGADCIGDVRVLPEGAPFATEPSFEAALDEPREVSFRALFEQSIGQPLSGPSVPGVQDKLSDAMLSLPTRHRGEAVILKLSPSAYPLLVENESLFLDWARFCGLAVPKHSIVTDRDGATGLVVSRFDRRGDAGAMTRVAQEDAVQVAGRWPAAKYSMSTRDVFEAVTMATPAARVSASKLLRLFAFSYLIGNGDLHAKNVSIYSPEGFWTVTPAYDLVSTIPYGDTQMALQLEGRTSAITGSTFVAFVERFGVNEKAARRVLNDVADRVDSKTAELESIGYDERRVRNLRRIIEKRISEVRS